MKTGLARFLQKYFYLSMGLLIAVVVAYGFGQTIDHNLLHASPVPPFILTIHAIVFPGWVLFFILQSTLVRTRNVRIHRTLGWFGVALAVTMLVVGFLTARGMDRFILQQSPLAPMAAFMIIQLMGLLGFAVAFTPAILLRRKPEFHRRLMLIASAALTDAAWARFPHSSLVLAECGVSLLVVLGIGRDVIVDSRVHTVYRYALPLLIAAQTLELYTYNHASPWWLRIAHVLLR
jgi:FtsH-binding integral membrane protein